ncbi:unnamed protein product [Merluccius merluccius]
MATLVCRVQFLDDTDPFNSTSFPEPSRPPQYRFREDIPLINQIAGLHRLLKAPHKLDDCALQLSHNGSYLDLDSSLAEQRDELEGFQEEGGRGKKHSIILRMQLSVRVHACIEKLYNCNGRDLRRALFSLKQIFQDDKDLVHEFVNAEGLTCLIKVGAEADHNYQNYILRALGQVMLYVDGMDGLITHNETVQWLYTLIGSKFRLVVKTALKLLLVFVEYTETNAALLMKAVNAVDSKRGSKLWCNATQILEQKDGVDTELLIYAMTLLNKTLAGLPDQDSYYDVVDSLEEQGLSAVAQRHLSRKGADLDLVEQFNIYETTLRSEDSGDEGQVASGRKERQWAGVGVAGVGVVSVGRASVGVVSVGRAIMGVASNPWGMERRRSCRHSLQSGEGRSSATVPSASSFQSLGGRVQDVSEGDEEEEEEEGEEGDEADCESCPVTEPSRQEHAGLLALEPECVSKVDLSPETAAEHRLVSPSEPGVKQQTKIQRPPAETEDGAEVQNEENVAPHLVFHDELSGTLKEEEEKLEEQEQYVNEVVIEDEQVEEDKRVLEEEARVAEEVSDSEGAQQQQEDVELEEKEKEEEMDVEDSVLLSEKERQNKEVNEKDNCSASSISSASSTLEREEREERITKDIEAGDWTQSLTDANVNEQCNKILNKKRFMLDMLFSQSPTETDKCEEERGDQVLFATSLASRISTLEAHRQAREENLKKMEVGDFDNQGSVRAKTAVDGKRQEIIVLDSKRSNAINIGLTVLPPPRTIKTAILNFDEYALNKEGIEKILMMVPTEEEKQRIQEAQLLNPEVPLGSAEQFLLTLSSITELAARLQLWAFKMDYEVIEKEVAEPLQDLKEGMDQLEKNKTLRCVLSTLLAIGNFLNGTNVKGFEWSYLEKVPEVKDTVHKQSLLHHVCSIVVDKFPESSDLYSEIGAITRSAKVDFDQLQDNLVQMEQRCKASWENLKVIAKHEMKQTLKQKTSDFLKDCAERIIILKIVHRRIVNRFHAFLLFLGHPAYAVREVSIQRFSRILSEFGLEYRTARERLLQHKQKRADHRQRNKTRGKMITDNGKFGGAASERPPQGMADAVDAADAAEHENMKAVLKTPGLRGRTRVCLDPPGRVPPRCSANDDPVTTDDTPDDIMERIVRSATQGSGQRTQPRERRRSRANRKSLRRTLKSGLTAEEAAALGLPAGEEIQV